MLIPLIALQCINNENRSEILKKWNQCGPIILDISGENSNSDYHQYVQSFAALLWQMSILIQGLPANQVDQIGEWLNFGAKKVIVSGNIEDICYLGSVFPKDRIVAEIPADEIAANLDTLAQYVGGIVVSAPNGNEDTIVSFTTDVWAKIKGSFPFGFILKFDDMPNVDNINNLVGKLHHIGGHDGIVDVASKHVSLDSDYKNGLSPGRSFVACLKSDRPDKLYSTVVVDELGVALGLVYSSDESILKSLECGRGVYWSRSRNGLWRKGDTSGAYQDLISIALDCDGDAVRFKVRQCGSPASFCHKGCRTCWGEDGGVGHLARTLESRKLDAPEGSYTKRLFNDPTLLRNKLLEEAQEVVEAIEERDSVHVAEEVGDLMYFLMTACYAGDATLQNVCEQLDMRSLKVKRRPGNAKDFRIQAAAELLKKN